MTAVAPSPRSWPAPAWHGRWGSSMSVITDPTPNQTTAPVCPFDCTVDLLKFVQHPGLMQHAAWREVTEWLRNRINVVEGIPWTDVLFLAERLAAGQSPTGNRGP